MAAVQSMDSMERTDKLRLKFNIMVCLDKVVALNIESDLEVQSTVLAHRLLEWCRGNEKKRKINSVPKF